MYTEKPAAELENRNNLDGLTFHIRHFHLAQHHCHNLENMACDHDQHLALVEDHVVILGGLCAFYLGKQSHHGVLEQVNRT